MHRICVSWGQVFVLVWLVGTWLFFSPWTGDGECQIHCNYLVLWSEIWLTEVSLMSLKAVVEASAVCFQKSCSRIWSAGAVCAVCPFYVAIFWADMSNFEGHSVCSVLSRLQYVRVKILLGSDSLYIEEEQNQLSGSSFYMNPCKIKPESANTQTSWILYLNVTPSQETQSHHSFSAPASAERQKTQELKHKPQTLRCAFSS